MRTIEGHIYPADDLAQLRAEIERLRAALEEQNGGMAIIRSATIEECARVAVEFMTKVYDEDKIGEAIAAAIRALKDIPTPDQGN